jgi:hypothetical protein
VCKKFRAYKTNQLSANTVAGRPEHIVRNADLQLQEKASKIERFSVAIDESRALRDTV